MSTRRHASVLACTVALVFPSAAYAQLDPPGAREHLKQGYALRKEGRCVDAIPHFVESVRLDPTAKALLNLAECERETGALAESLKHAADARDRARAENQSELLALAEELVSAIEKRFARVTIHVAPTAPRDVVVLRDGVELGRASLGAELPVAPGRHTIHVRAVGHRERAYELDLTPGEKRDVVVEAGDVSASDPAVATPPSDPAGESHGSSAAPWVASGIGIALVATGAALGLAASGRWSDAKETCGAGCAPDSPAEDAKKDAETLATWSTVTFAAGGAALATAVVLWVVLRGPPPVRASARGLTVTF